MDNNGFRPILDPELQAMMSLIQEKPVLRNMIELEDFDSAYDVYEYYKNLPPPEPQPLPENPNHDESFQPWLKYAQILDPNIQMIPSNINPSIPNQPQVQIPFENPEIIHGNLDDNIEVSNSRKKRLAETTTSNTSKPKKSKRSYGFAPWSTTMEIHGIDVNISDIPTPVCSCTGTPQKCYRWGYGSWQSACCTTTISEYPLPKGNNPQGKRIAGRKMGKNAFKTVLAQALFESHNLFVPIDLKSHWAKRGSNQFRVMKKCQSSSAS